MPTPTTNCRKLGALTDRQLEVFRFIAHEIEGGMPPTVREIGEHFEINSPNGVMCHLKALASKGWITVEGAASRGIRLTWKAQDTLPKKKITCPNCKCRFER